MIENIFKNKECKKIEYKAEVASSYGYGSYQTDEDEKVFEFLRLCIQDKQDEAIKYFEDNNLSPNKYIRFNIEEEKSKLSLTNADTNSGDDNNISTLANRFTSSIYSTKFEAVVFKIIQIGSDKVFEHILGLGKYVYNSNERGVRQYLSDQNNDSLPICVGKKFIKDPSDQKNINLLNILIKHIDVTGVGSISNTDNLLNILTRYKEIDFTLVKTLLTEMNSEYYIANRNTINDTSALINVIKFNREDLIKLFIDHISSMSNDEYNMLNDDMKKYVDKHAIVLTTTHTNHYVGYSSYY